MRDRLRETEGEKNREIGMEKKKEKCGRQRMRVDSGREAGDERGTLLLANPMAGGEVAASLPPAGPPAQPQPRVPLAGARKTRPKSPSLLRFFVRGGVSRKGSEEEEGMDSAGSDHDDPFPVRRVGMRREGERKVVKCASVLVCGWEFSIE